MLQFLTQYVNIKKRSDKTTCIAQKFWSFNFFLLYFYFANYLKQKYVKCTHFKYSTYFQYLHNTHTLHIRYKQLNSIRLTVVVLLQHGETIQCL